MRVQRAAIGAATCLVLVGCGSSAADPATPAPTPAPTSPAPSSPSASTQGPQTGPTAPVGTRPVVDCLNGTYRLSRVLDVDPDAPYASGTGGDVELIFSGAEFPDGNYVGTAYALVAGGQRRMSLTAPDGATSSLVVKAKAEGSYTLSDSEAVFARGPGSGSGRLTSGGTTRTLDLAEVQAVVTPVGTMTVSCTKTTLWLTGSTLQLELKAV